MTTTYKNLLAGACAALALLAAGNSADAQGYPNQRITFVVGFAAGGFADSVARLVGDHVSKALGQTVVVENRGGAGSNIAAQAVANAEPDGYTVLVSTTALAINASAYKHLAYKIGDLVPVAMPVSAPETIDVPPAKPHTLKEFVAMAKQKEVTFASAGAGTGSHLATQYFFKNEAKVMAAHVPFKGGAPATQAAIGNQVDALASTLSGNTAAMIKDGKLVCLGVAAAERSPRVPDCPTFAESGYPGFEASSWVGFFLPPKTDKAVVAKLAGAINSALDDPETKAKLSKNGTLTKRSPAEAAQFMKSEIANWKKMVSAAGFTVE